MRILAIETTEKTGSVAAAEGNNLLLELDLRHDQRSAQSLAPAIAELLATVGWRPAEVELVAVGIGPGSFTGLRVGVTAAKTLAYAVGADILGVDTLEVIAAAAPDDVPLVAAAVDAQRGEVVAATFRRDAGGWLRPEAAAALVEIDRWLGSLPDGMAVSGPILRKIADRVPKRLRVLPPECWRARAGNVARLAARDYAAGRRDDLWTLAPHYSRLAAAEEKWQRRQAGDSGGGPKPDASRQDA